jgi:D-alanyl-lipoteichoic acid acyltransferase DltB (MBOAT superfamily)
MSFTTFLFFGFLALVLLGWYLLPGRGRRLWLLAANYVFYMWSMPALGLLLLASTALSYGAARWMGTPEQGSAGRRRAILTAACLIHFGLLFVCKYLQMALDLLGRVLPGAAGLHVELLLPAGISFFTFAVTGYLFDVYRGKTAAEKNFLDYAVFVSFFPCILAGPIGQARSFLPQLRERIAFDGTRLKGGLLRFAWGMVQKLVLADNIGTLVNAAYGGRIVTPLTWIAVILLYSLQIYFDFAGYSNMAIGTAQAMGLRVPENFDAPYWSASVTAFWKKWHMSLTGWFREYLYFPLGGSRKGKARTCLNILIVFAVSGLWHGAAMHYVVWGLLNGVFQVWERITAPLRSRVEARLQRPALRWLSLVLRWALTYCLISVTWLCFRAESFAQLRFILGQVLGLFRTGLGVLDLKALGLKDGMDLVLLIGVGLAAGVDGLRARGKRPDRLSKTVLPYYLVMVVLLTAAALFGVYGKGFDPQDFVYFKY